MLRYYAMAAVFALALVACGKATYSTAPSGVSPALTVIASGPRGETFTESGGGATLRANGRDALTVAASVSGLSTDVAFFIPEAWGAWQGGQTGSDGFIHYSADVSGKARGTLVAGLKSGRQQIIVRSRDAETRLTVTFDFATLTLFPSVIVIDGAPGASALVEAHGAMPPLTWSVSHQQSLRIYERDATSIYLSARDEDKPLTSASLPSGGATLYARDAEGQIATAQVFVINRGCAAASLTISPSTGQAGPFAVTVTVEDTDRAGAASVDVQIADGATLDGGSSATVAAVGSAGLFSTTFTLATPGDGAYSIFYTDSDDPDTNCAPVTLSRQFTDTP